MKKTAYLILTITLWLSFFNNSYALENLKCIERLQSCFALSQAELTGCYYSTAADKSCHGTELAGLLLNRWSLTPSQADPKNQRLNFVGTQLASGTCLERFDTQLAAWSLSPNFALTSLAELLDSCTTGAVK